MIKQKKENSKPLGFGEDFLLSDCRERANKLWSSMSTTDLYSTGYPELNEWLGNSTKGGMGRPDGYELVLIYGPTGCIDGQAEIYVRGNRTRNKKPIKLEHLYRRLHDISYRGMKTMYRGDESFKVRSINEETGEMEWSDVLDVVDQGFKPSYRITTKSGRSVIATDNHPFWNGSGWTELKDLRIGDLVGTLAKGGIQKRQGKHAPRDYEYLVKHHPTATKKVVNGCTYYRIPEHRFIYEAHMNNMTAEEYRKLLNNYDGRFLKTLPRGVEVDHINNNHYDNRIENMQLLSKSEHAKKTATQPKAKETLIRYPLMDEIVSIEFVGEHHVYDIKCIGNHSFVADGFVVHNCGKSSIAINMLLDSVRHHIPQAWLILEDDPADTLNRLCVMANDREQTMKDVGCVHLMSETMLDSSFRLQDIIDWIKMQSDRGIKLFLIDHLQFAFENSEDILEKNELINQRVFMKDLNFLAKKNNLTVIMISHTNKNTKAEGLDKVLGSSAIVQASTKVLEVIPRFDGSVGLLMWKSRFTPVSKGMAAFSRTKMHYKFIRVLNDDEKNCTIQERENLYE